MKWFVLLLTLSAATAQVKITQHGKESISVAIDGKPFTEFFIGAAAPKPYLDPLRAATGTVVTRGYPMREIVGEAHDHPHHRGLWFTHGDVNGFDFWANEEKQKGVGKGKGVITLVKVNRAAGDTIDATFDWAGADGTKILTEHRVMKFYAKPDVRMIDFDITLTAVEKAVFGDTKEGTFAIRLAAALEEPEKKSLPEPKRTGQMVNAEGAKGEKAVWGKASPWVDYSGEIAGEKVGVAIFEHPSSLKHPTYWHSRAYGLFAANPFGEHDFFADKSRNGSVTVEAGKSVRFRYRVLIHPAGTDLAKAYAEYAK